MVDYTLILSCIAPIYVTQMYNAITFKYVKLISYLCIRIA